MGLVAGHPPHDLIQEGDQHEAAYRALTAASRRPGFSDASGPGVHEGTAPVQRADRR
jgi:hypothetical protein